ncbi:MAG: hypothetical protein FJZ58_08315, partial [Chlamydiae bacterium]|nr:hypothetical protein [Chlamydiota bacterium]
MKKTDKATKKTLFIVILALVGLITISPWVISSPLGTRLLTSFMSSKASGSVALESLTLRWFGPQKIVGASFISRDESLHVTCQDLEIQASLFALLTRPHSLPHVRITRPTCTLDQQKRQASSPPLVISSSSLFPSSPTLLSSPFP